MDVTGCDYDHLYFHLFATERSALCLSLAAPYLPTLLKLKGFNQQLQEWGLKLVPTEVDYDLTVKLNDLQQASLLPQLAYRCLAWPLSQAMASQQAGEPCAPLFIPLRSQEEGLWIEPSADRVTVILATRFTDPDDALLGKVFLQELYDQRKDLAHQDAPALILSKTPPTEFKALVASDAWYLTMVLFPRHYVRDNHRTIHAVITLRDYLHYHIKCCKVQLHVRMRHKSDQLVKQLNRAQREYA